MPPAWHSAGISSLPGHLPAAGRPVVLDVVGRRLAAGAQRPGRAAPGEGGTRREGAPGGRCLARRAVPGRRSPTARLAQVPRGGTGRAAFVSNDMPKRGTPVDEPPWYELPLPGSRPEVVAWLRERTRLREAISSRLRSTDSSTQRTRTSPRLSGRRDPTRPRGPSPTPRGWPRPEPEERCPLERRHVSPERPPAAGRTHRATAGRRTASRAGSAPRGPVGPLCYMQAPPEPAPPPHSPGSNPPGAPMGPPREVGGGLGSESPGWPDGSPSEVAGGVGKETALDVGWVPLRRSLRQGK